MNTLLFGDSRLACTTALGIVYYANTQGKGAPGKLRKLLSAINQPVAFNLFTLHTVCSYGGAPLTKSDLYPYAPSLMSQPEPTSRVLKSMHKQLLLSYGKLGLLAIDQGTTKSYITGYICSVDL